MSWNVLKNWYPTLLPKRESQRLELCGNRLIWTFFGWEQLIIPSLDPSWRKDGIWVGMIRHKSRFLSHFYASSPSFTLSSFKSDPHPRISSFHSSSMDLVSQEDHYPLGRGVSDSIRSLSFTNASIVKSLLTEHQARCPTLALANAPRIHPTSPDPNHQGNEGSRARNRNRVCMYSNILSFPFPTLSITRLS